LTLGGIMTRKDKIQYLLVTHLLDEGMIELKLPDGMTIELGILKESKNGNLVKDRDYCWVIASQKDREVSIDAYNVAMRYKEENNVLLENIVEEKNGEKVHVFSVC
jgi:hypothetical protein